MDLENKPTANGGSVNSEQDNDKPTKSDRHKWVASLEYILESILKNEEPEQAALLVEELSDRLRQSGLKIPLAVSTPYINTIPPEKQPPYPGDREIERRIKSYVRWNAMAMVVNANRKHDGLGGHISTYASSRHAVRSRPTTIFSAAMTATRRRHGLFPGPRHAGQSMRAPFSKAASMRSNLQNFRQELAEGGGLSSYPHPYLMPDFWQFPTVSMGLGPIMSIYQARFNRYLKSARLDPEARSPKSGAFVGDGECDEPETLGALTLAARENLDNLIWVVNCNLQRLDGPVRGNGKIIQELEALFRGAGWNVIKVIWGSDWDASARRGPERAAAQAHGRSRRRRLPEILRRARQLHPQTFLRQVSRAARSWSTT